jgi:hypothetical protein
MHVYASLNHNAAWVTSHWHSVQQPPPAGYVWHAAPRDEDAGQRLKQPVLHQALEDGVLLHY